VSHGRNKKEAVTHTGKKCFHPFVHTYVKYTLYAIFFFHSLFCCVSVVHRIHDVYAGKYPPSESARKVEGKKTQLRDIYPALRAAECREQRNQHRKNIHPRFTS